MITTLTLNPGIDRTLLLPNVDYNTVCRASKVYLASGGKGINVSRVLKQFGIASCVMGFSGGYTGAQLEGLLESEGYKTDFLKIKGETRNNVVIIESNTSKYIKVNEPGPIVTPNEQAALLEKIHHSIKPGDYWILSGSLPPGVLPSYMQTIVQLIQNMDGKVFLDTSDAALKMGCIASPFLVKPNQYEASEVTGLPIHTTLDAVRVSEELLLFGAHNVAISLGENGVVFNGELGSYHAIPPTVETMNPTGAGDSLLAGLIYGLSNSLPIDDSIRWGVAAGTASAMKEEIAKASFSEIKNIYHMVKINKI